MDKSIKFDIWWKEYKDWLIDRIGFYDEYYKKLISELHDIPFTFLIEKDANRAEDGKYYRNEFLSSLHEDDRKYVLDCGYFEQQPCSVLEMLVGMAIRIEDEYTGTPGEERPDLIFFDMVQNLRLSRFTDSNFDKEKVDEIVKKWLDRDFESSGLGSIFPLNHTKRDQKKIEIWDQAMEYLSENF